MGQRYYNHIAGGVHFITFGCTKSVQNNISTKYYKLLLLFVCGNYNFTQSLGDTFPQCHQ